MEYLDSMNDKNQLALKALRMCFLPYAYQYKGLKGQALRRTAQEMIWTLEAWTEQMRVAFGIERPVATPSVPVYASVHPPMAAKVPDDENEDEALVDEEESSWVGNPVRSNAF